MPPNTQQQPPLSSPPPAAHVSSTARSTGGSAFDQIVDKIKAANNVLVTVSNDPSVDQLAACLGLTLAINKADKHGTAVFSGQVPSTIEFLKPEETLEQNTDSLRDFIISLDRSKADKLRYKLEDNFVKIFITPYKTSIGQEDLNFSQGDFNIDLIITLGIKQKEQLDAAIVAHGRILHDATIASINLDSASDIGTINWTNPEASSLSEMVSDLIIKINDKLLDQQISTALLTGMVAETDRFGNEKARPHTMSVSGVLMASGASTQLVSAKLEEAAAKAQQEADDAKQAEQTTSPPEADTEKPGEEIPPVAEDQKEESTPAEKPETEDNEDQDDGTIKIDHAPQVNPEEQDDIHIDDEGRLQAIQEMKAQREAEVAAKAKREAEEKAAKVSSATKPSAVPGAATTGQKPFSPTPPPNGRGMMTGPPSFSGQLTANSIPEHQRYSPSTDPLSGNTKSGPILDHNLSSSSADQDQTLEDLEKKVNSPHIGQTDQPPQPPQPPQSSDYDSKPSDQKDADGPADSPNDSSKESPKVQPKSTPVSDAGLDEVRSIVEKAANNPDFYRPEPPQASGAQNIGLNLSHDSQKQDDQDGANDQSQNTQGNNAQTDKKDVQGPPPPVPPPMSPPSL